MPSPQGQNSQHHGRGHQEQRDVEGGPGARHGSDVGMGRERAGGHLEAQRRDGRH
jgi:hypothetical protein